MAKNSHGNNNSSIHETAMKLERLHSEDTPPPPPNDYPYHWVILDPKSKEDKVKVTNLKNSSKFQIFEFWNGHYTRHTFWSCLIRCANMKWIWWVLLKIQSGHDSVHRWTDGQTDKVIPVYPPFNFVEAGGINIWKDTHISKNMDWYLVCSEYSCYTWPCLWDSARLHVKVTPVH